MNMQRFEAYLTNNNFLDCLIGESIKILYFSIMIKIILNLFLSYFPKHQRYCRYIYYHTPVFSVAFYILTVRAKISFAIIIITLRLYVV